MTKSIEPKIGYWFSAGDTLPRGDGRKIVIGERLGVNGKLVICKNALHGSFDAFDALAYAPGSYLHKCLFEGERIEEKDKLGSRYRTVLARADATDMLRHFSRQQALSVADKWDMPPVVRQYLETGDESLRSAAWSAAHSAAYREADGAVHSAARSAEREVHNAARCAADSAAWSAADNTERDVRSAAWSAADSAAWSTAHSAADSAVYSAARDAAWGAARQMFNETVTELFKEAE